MRARLVARTFCSLSGTHTIRRHYHYREECKHGFYPRDLLLGLPEEGDLSEELEARAADFAVNDVYELAEQRWNLHYPYQVSSNQFRQVAKRLGRLVEESNPVVLQGAALVPEFKPSATLYIMNDGGMVPMREGKWSEVKMGVFFREEDHLSHREAKRGAITRALYVAILGEQAEFKAEMEAAMESHVDFGSLQWLAQAEQLKHPG